MDPIRRVSLTAGILVTFCTAAHAAPPDFGAKASGSELNSGITEDGGPGISSASVSEADFTADASFLATSTTVAKGRFALVHRRETGRRPRSNQ